MEIARESFNIFMISGVWRPVRWTSGGMKMMYSFFTSFVLFSVYTMVAFELGDVFMNVRNFNDFTNSCYMLSAMINVCAKGTSMVVHRKKIIGLVETLSNRPYKPMCDAEKNIIAKFDSIIRINTMRYLIMVAVNAVGFIVRALLCLKDGTLPYPAWYPFNFSIRPIYFLCWIHQFISVSILACTISLAMDTLIPGFMIHVYAQLEILKYRLQNITKIKNHTNVYEYGYFAACVQHHDSIFRYANMLNTTFKSVFLIQFIVSTAVFCTTVFHLSVIHDTISADFVSSITYLCGSMIQIFLYCWCGNEITLQSLDISNTVYNIDWTLLPPSEKRDLVIIMMRSSIPIKFSSNFLVTMSIDSFVKILKTSYSAFNLMKQTSD